MPNIWRHPDKETIDIYPGLTVHDGRCSGSITAGQSRLPLWAFCWPAIVHGWEEAESGWTPSDYGMDAESFAWFVSDLLEARGEFARLLCVLADAERAERHRQGIVVDYPFPCLPAVGRARAAGRLAVHSGHLRGPGRARCGAGPVGTWQRARVRCRSRAGAGAGPPSAPRPMTSAGRRSGMSSPQRGPLRPRR